MGKNKIRISEGLKFHIDRCVGIDKNMSGPDHQSFSLYLERQDS